MKSTWIALSYHYKIADKPILEPGISISFQQVVTKLASRKFHGNISFTLSFNFEQQHITMSPTLQNW